MLLYREGIRGVKVAINGNGDPSLNPWISHRANSLGKAINANIFYPAMD